MREPGSKFFADNLTGSDDQISFFMGVIGVMVACPLGLALAWIKIPVVIMRMIAMITMNDNGQTCMGRRVQFRRVASARHDAKQKHRDARKRHDQTTPESCPQASNHGGLVSV